MTVSSIFAKLHRATARILLLVMLSPAFVPLALAGIAPSQDASCCRRHALTDASSPAADQPVMHCHHAAQPNAAPLDPDSQASFRSHDCCCQNCDCCRNAKTSVWARPVPTRLTFVTLVIAPAARAQNIAPVSTFIAGSLSARAPPLG